MVPMTNKSFIYKKIPDIYLIPGEHLVVEDRPLDLDAAPLEGGILIKVLYASFDPYIRDRTRDPAQEDFIPPLEVDTPIVSSIVGKIVRSESLEYQTGDLVSVLEGEHAEYTVIPGSLMEESGVKKLVNPYDLPISYFLGVLGMPGCTAFQGLYGIGQPRRGEVIFVSAAAGAVGQCVGQLAKSEGLKVIGSAGSQAKVDFLTQELGFDGAFNYKTEDALQALSRLAPDGIDIFWDGVGGPQLDAALAAMKPRGRVVSCGTMALYHDKPENLYGVKNIWMLTNKSIRMQGFIFDMNPEKHQALVNKVAPLLASGDFKVLQDVTLGIENAPEGLAGVFTGQNFGKAVLKIAQPDA